MGKRFDAINVTLWEDVGIMGGSGVAAAWTMDDTQRQITAWNRTHGNGKTLQQLTQEKTFSGQLVKDARKIKWRSYATN